MKRLVLFAAVFLVAACGQSAQSAPPRPSLSPKADACHAVNGLTWCVLNPNVTQSTISTTICTPDWTKTIRPDAQYTNALKRDQISKYASRHVGDMQWNTRDTEEDHRLPLELGGSPRDPMNLSPEVHRTSAAKDQDENLYKGSVCTGQMTLVQAQQQFIGKWLAAYPDYKQ